MDKIKANSRYKPPTISDNGFHIDADNWYFTVRAVLQEEPLLLAGPTCCGKTELMTFVANAVARPSHFIDMGGMLDGVSGLIGVHRIKNGDSIFDFAKFAQVIQHPSIVVLDELNRAPITTRNILFPCLDFRKTLPASVAASEDLRDIPLNEDCYIAATANLGAQYTGTSSLDRALQDRFTLFELDYLDEDTEVLVLEARTGVGLPVARRVVGVMNSIRESYKLGELSTAVSTRHGLKVGRYIYDGLEPVDAMAFAFLPIFEGTTSEGERSVVYNLILGK
jgi:MoxR-like ATPase